MSVWHRSVPGERKMTFLGIGHPVCRNCDGRMRITRRGSHVDERGYFERQEFVCANCDLRLERRVTTDGKVQELVLEVS